MVMLYVVVSVFPLSLERRKITPDNGYTVQGQIVANDVCHESKDEQCVDSQLQPDWPTLMNVLHDGEEKNGHQHIHSYSLHRIGDRILYLTDDIA